MTSAIDLRLGRWQDALADVECDALICDPPYSARTDKGYRTSTDFDADKAKSKGKGVRPSHVKLRGDVNGGSMPRRRYELQYKPIDQEWVKAFCDFFVPRTRLFFVMFGDHTSARWFESEFIAHKLVTFAPVPWIKPDPTPRFMADGPTNACEWITIARHRRMPERFSRRGYYEGSCQGEKIVTGGKPLWLMQALVRDYSRPGDLVCDPCAGGATTLLAAAIEGRRAVGCEMDPATFRKAQRRIAKGYTPSMFTANAKGVHVVQPGLFK